MKTFNFMVLPGDGVGPEVMKEALKILEALKEIGLLDFNCEEGLVGGASLNRTGLPISDKTMSLAKSADAILFGAVGDSRFDANAQNLKPEAAILRLRKELNLFANLRPIKVFDELLENSSLKPELLKGLDIMIVRELTGDLYFGEPRGVSKSDNGELVSINSMVYKESEIKRVALLGFEISKLRKNKLTSVDKANVLETMQLWRKVVNEVSLGFENVLLDHLYVDNAAMQLVKDPKQFDVILTGNLFGDILSDQASMLSGSIGMLPSASLNNRSNGLYEPIHGSAPDIANKDLVNPIAMIMSVAMMFRYTLKMENVAKNIELAVANVLAKEYATADIYKTGWKKIGTSEMGNKIRSELKKIC